MKQLKNSLLELGFSEHDASVYLALTKYSPCNAGPVIKETGLHRNIVYTSFDHLLARNLVGEKVVRGRKQFSIQSPDVLAADFAQKAVLAKKVSEHIRKQSKVETSQVTLYQNEEEFGKELLKVAHQLADGDKVYVFGAMKKGIMYDSLLDSMPNYVESLINKKLDLQILTSRSRKKPVKEALNRFWEHEFQVRHMPISIDEPELIVALPSIDTLVYFISDEDVTGIIFKHPGITNSLISLFTNFWKFCL